MKYRQLTKEQFESLHEEFAKFLATQQIDAKEWNEIKLNKPKVAEEEMNIFSDMVWEDVLKRTNYLEHFSSNSINLFRSDAEFIHRIVVEVKKENFNFLKPQDYEWFVNNSKDDSIDYFKGQKPYLKERNVEIFELIEKGSVISEGELYEAIFKIIS
ncbi:DUF6495 family protein [Urechidicola croceus]|uniref:Histidyl-tRNA synthetase n=1 Tax=Urechidicola croceus TaxID=1850246 RepID=A0A1D8PBM2_9FLAO|nr:DUF6495 family protein [Urechidicola croceus]AOW21987.1 hypothetical protein LPB138_02595 [Urechidicola croceus]